MRPPNLLRQRIIVAILALAASAPFLNKAFHIDDALYLMVAEQILRDPAHPYAGDVVWDDPQGNPKPLYLTDFNPPLWKYMMAAVMLTCGTRELPLHILESSFVILGAFGLLELGRRFTQMPVFAVALILLGPFFLPGQNVMLEGPLLCLCIWALELQLRGIERNRLSWSIAAGLLLAIAVLIKYTSGLFWLILLVPVLQTRSWRSLVYLVLPVAALLSWALFSRSIYGSSHFGAQSATSGLTELLSRARTVLHCVGSMSLFAPLLLFSFRGWLRWGLALLAIGLGVGFAYADNASILSFSQLRGWTPSTNEQVHHALFSFNGVVTLLLLAFAAGRLLFRNQESDQAPADQAQLISAQNYDVLLIAWILLFVAFNLVSVPFIAIRHLLFAFIPMTWLICRHLDHGGDLPRMRWLTLAASMLLGIALAHADCEFASVYREVADQQIRMRTEKGFKVAFSGGWGWSHYARHAGARPLANGDLNETVFIEPMVLNWHDLYRTRRIVPTAKLVEGLRPKASTPFRTVAPNVNYYSVLPHTLPWQFLFLPPVEAGDVPTLPPIDEILIYRKD